MGAREAIVRRLEDLGLRPDSSALPALEGPIQTALGFVRASAPSASSVAHAQAWQETWARWPDGLGMMLVLAVCARARWTAACARAVRGRHLAPFALLEGDERVLVGALTGFVRQRRGHLTGDSRLRALDELLAWTSTPTRGRPNPLEASRVARLAHPQALGSPQLELEVTLGLTAAAVQAEALWAVRALAQAAYHAVHWDSGAPLSPARELSVDALDESRQRVEAAAGDLAREVRLFCPQAPDLGVWLCGCPETAAIDAAREEAAHLTGLVEDCPGCSCGAATSCAECAARCGARPCPRCQAAARAYRADAETALLVARHARACPLLALAEGMEGMEGTEGR